MTAIFPTLPGLAINVKRSVLTSTGIQAATSGKVQAASWWSSPKYQFTLTVNFLRQAGFSAQTVFDEANTLTTFFWGQGGQLTPFWFLDPYDSTALLQNFGTGDATTTAFQLVDNLGVATVPFGAVQIYVNGVLKTLTTDYAVSSTGLITFVVAPAAAAALTWTGSYYYVVRFQQDNLDLEQIVNMAWSGGSLKLVGVK